MNICNNKTEDKGLGGFSNSFEDLRIDDFDKLRNLAFLYD